jgi:hypothetical protein
VHRAEHLVRRRGRGKVRVRVSVRVRVGASVHRAEHLVVAQQALDALRVVEQLEARAPGRCREM